MFISLRFGCNPQIIFLSLFSQFELSHFLGSTSTKIYIDNWYLVNTTPQIILKLWRCFCEGLKMCMRFGCNPQIFFVTFSQFELKSILGSTSTKAYRHWVSSELSSSYNFSSILLKLWAGFFVKVSRFAYHLDAILRLFLSLICSLNLVLFLTYCFTQCIHQSVGLWVTKLYPL